MSRMFVLLILLAGSVEAKEVFRCTDPDTGSVTFTDRGCKHGEDGAVHTFKGNVVHSLDKQPVGQRYNTSRQQVQVIEQIEAQRPQAFLIGDTPARSREMDRICREAATPHRGAQNRQLTASQRQTLAACAGLPTGQTSSDSYSIPVTTPQPATTPQVIPNCDMAGCWDNQGGRYTKGAGNTYIHQNGTACQLIGGMMHCP